MCYWDQTESALVHVCIMLGSTDDLNLFCFAECINIPMRMKYRKISEIEQYLGLVHQLQLLQLQNHVVDTCKDSILPLLTSMEPIQGQVNRCLNLPNCSRLLWLFY